MSKNKNYLFLYSWTWWTWGLTTYRPTSPVITVIKTFMSLYEEKTKTAALAYWRWCKCHKVGSWTEPLSFIWPQWHVWSVGAGVGGRREGAPLLWQWRTNINLLQQSIFHHTYSQGTSQSGLYPFCQWLPSSISFIENYTPDQCSSRPLSICRGVAEVGGWVEGGWGSGVCVAACCLRSDGYLPSDLILLAARSCPDNSHHVV